MASMRAMVDRLSGMRATLSLGFFDSALASLATFLVGLYATRYFSSDELGAYAVFFGGFLLIIMVPAELVYRPTEVVTVAYPPRERLGVLPNSLRIGTGPALIVSVLVTSAAMLVPAEVPFGTVVALASTAAVSGFLSPAQDHVRRMFHQAGRSGSAVMMSSIQLGVVLAALVAWSRVGVDRAWIPLGALASANLLSLAAGCFVALRTLRGGRVPLHSKALYRTGGWLLVSGFAIVGGQVAGIVLTTILAGAEYAGFAQAAIVLAQPLFVLSTGLGAVLNPHIMEAAGSGEESDARGSSHLYAGLMLAATLALTVLIGWDWLLNPLPELFPNAYTVTGLLAMTILVQGCNYALFGAQFQLIGGFAHTQMAKSTVAGSVVQMVIGSAASMLRSFTVAIGIGSAVAVKAMLYRRALRAMYAASRSGPGA